MVPGRLTRESEKRAHNLTRVRPHGLSVRNSCLFHGKLPRIVGMMNRLNRFLIIALFGLLTISANAQSAGDSNPADTSKSSGQREKKVAAGENETKRLLLLMDKDANGKVSKQEFMDFMEAEFARLDKNHDGELDVKELTQMQIRFRTPSRR